MVFRIEHMKRKRREAFAGGSGGGYCLHALSPQERIPQSRFQQASRIELDPGSVVGEHVHRNNEELYWIVSGMGVFTDDGIEAPAKAEAERKVYRVHCPNRFPCHPPEGGTLFVTVSGTILHYR